MGKGLELFSEYNALWSYDIDIAEPGVVGPGVNDADDGTDDEGVAEYDWKATRLLLSSN